MRKFYVTVVAINSSSDRGSVNANIRAIILAHMQAARIHRKNGIDALSAFMFQYKVVSCRQNDLVGLLNL